MKYALTRQPIPLVQDRVLPAGPHLPPLPDWPAGREPDFVAWQHYARNGVQYGRRLDSALVSWVRHRFVRPVPTSVYVLRLANLTSLYVGVSNDLDRRMREHAEADAKVMQRRFAPNRAWIGRHGLAHVKDGRAVPEWVAETPDRVCALLLEVLVTCVLVGAGLRVHGQDLDDLCPVSEFLRQRASWDRHSGQGPRSRVWADDPTLPDYEAPVITDLAATA